MNYKLENKYKLYFLELDNTISTFIDTLNNAGKIYIVTNASLNWIKSCLKILNFFLSFKR